jgi:hypothetical protein
MDDRPQKVSQFNAVLSTLLVVVAMKPLASRADLGWGWKMAVLIGAAVPCADARL